MMVHMVFLVLHVQEFMSIFIIYSRMDAASWKHCNNMSNVRIYYSFTYTTAISEGAGSLQVYTKTESTQK